MMKLSFILNLSVFNNSNTNEMRNNKHHRVHTQLPG